jgi:hypothetical protein
MLVTLDVEVYYHIGRVTHIRRLQGSARKRTWRYEDVRSHSERS